MDPLSALGIAGNVVQFIDFTCKLVSTGQRIHGSASGALVENLEIEAIAQSVRQLSGKVYESLETISQVPTLVRVNRRGFEASTGIFSSKGEQEEENVIRSINASNASIREVCQQCARVSGELLEVLETLKFHGSNRTWNTFRSALKSVWDERKIEEILQRLQRLRAQLDSAILVSLRQKIDEAQLQNFQLNGRVENVMESTQAIQEKLLGHMQQSKKWQAEVISAIYQSSWQSQNRNHIHQFSSKLSGMASAQWDDQLKLRLLNRLQFPGMSDRKARIALAHRKTFQWLYRDPEEGRKPWGNFVKWLEGGSGNIYWITGKPGSGKSTLMKWLSDNPRTWQHLRVWSKGAPLIAAGFFFWNSGNEMQMSSMGLLQTLLFNCLRQRQSLIPVVFPDRWQQCQLFGQDFHPWSWEELKTAFEAFINEEKMRSKFFFFIDGLDEFNGEHPQLIQLIQATAIHRTVKICLASRPWLVFEDAFGRLPSLMLQDLTHPDIKIFVESQVLENPRFCQLQAREPAYAHQLIREITEKSAGVFLWINLVVRSLLEGLVNSDRLSDLARRLGLMPDDLDGLYTNILRSLDRFYFDHASQLFQVVRASSDPLSLLEVSFSDEEDPNFALRAEIKPLAQDEKQFRCDTMKRRLNSRCKGLLEVPALQPKRKSPLEIMQHQGPSSLLSNDPAALLVAQPSSGSPSRQNSGRAPSVYSPDDLGSLKVEYLHRTVKDFFEKPEVWRMILNATQPSFDPNASLARGFLMRLKDHSEDKLTGKDNMWRAVECCWNYASQAETNYPGSQTAIQQELERVTTHLNLSPCGADIPISTAKKVDVVTQQSALLQYRSPSKALSTDHRVRIGTRQYLTFQAQSDLYQAVQSQIQAGHLIAQDPDGRPLLSLAILEFETFSILRMRLIKLLLEHGASVNQAYEQNREAQRNDSQRNQRSQQSTPWKDLTAQAALDAGLDTHPSFELLMGRWAELARLFIAHGPTVEKTHIGEGVECIRRAFWRWDPVKTKELEEGIMGTTSIGTTSKSQRNSMKPKLFSRKGSWSAQDNRFWRALSSGSRDADKRRAF